MSSQNPFARQTDEGDARYSVDRLLLEQGQYTPLELLLWDGRLSYHDYEQWRCLQLERLDGALFGDPLQLRRLLQYAETYARLLGLQAEPVRYLAWDGSHAELFFSDDSEFNRLFHTRYTRSKNEVQMDLFMDSPATSLVNGAIAALVERRFDEAKRLWDKLYELDPMHARIGELEPLIQAGEKLQSQVEDPAEELAWLKTTVLPPAQSLLGAHSHNLMVPHWRRLSDGLTQRPYDPLHPELHLSYTAAQAQDWQRVLQSIETVPEWENVSALLQRYVQAWTELRQPIHGLPAWFRACWLFPESAAAYAVAPEWKRLWQRFSELDPEVDTAFFPAWVVLSTPGLARQLPQIDGPDTPAVAALRIAWQMQMKGSEGLKDVALRRDLKKIDTVLFQHFLNSLSTYMSLPAT